MKLLDLFCGAGGAAMGYSRAGFDVVGIDDKPQPNYPFQFIQGDTLNPPVDLQAFDFIHTSPQCQRYSSATPTNNRANHPDYVQQTRTMLQASGKFYIIENVVGAPLKNPMRLCGTMFGLNVIRHRLFETWPEIYFAPHPCYHYKKTVRQGYAPDPETQFHCVVGNFGGVELARTAMGINWMNRKELSQSIPPAYTEWIGKQMLSMVTQNEGE